MPRPGSDVLRVSAPARANLIGNPSDLYGGAVLSCTVPLRARVELRTASRLEIASDTESATIASSSDLALRGDGLDLARSALRSLAFLPAVRLAWRSDIPPQSGIAGSSALLVALLHALLTWEGCPMGLIELAERARRVEREILGVTCGYVDFYLASLGGLRFVDCRGNESGEEAATFARAEPLEAPLPLPFLLAYTGVRHHSGRVHEPIRARWEAGEPEVVRAYARLAELADEGKAAFLGADWNGLGRLMNENHTIQQGLGGSGEVDDRLIEAARRAGAPGAKLAGAGHGGTIVALWPHPDLAPLEAALREAGAAALFRPEPVEGVRIDPV